jgi:hypothetical protein
LDFGNRQVVVSQPFYPSNSEKNDFDYILQFFKPLKGKIPSLGFEGIQNQFDSNE